MSLEETKIKELILAPTKKELLREAESHQNRLALHSESDNLNIGRREVSYNPAFKDFNTWVSSILPTDKYQRFRQLLKPPFSTLTLTSEIWVELERIFDGQNAFFSYEFTNTDLQKDFREYLSKLDDRNFFKTKGFEQLKTGINSVLVVDLPSEVTGDKLEPFYYFVQVEHIIDVNTNRKGDIEHIIFHLSDNLIGAYDSEFYRVFKKEDDIVTTISESAHGLGYCPASFFWDKDLRKDNNILKKSPVTDVLSLLDRYLAGDTYKEHADLYTPYPIVVSMEKLCNFEGCQDGYITKETQIYNHETNEAEINRIPTKCPSCEQREFVGAGTNFEYPAKQTPDDPDLSNPVTIVSAETKPLEYLKKKLEELSFTIKSAVIGTASKIVDKSAVNEAQMLGSFESRRNVLVNLKESFEKIHKFANDTVARLRYENQFHDSVVFYGDEFYLKDLTVLQEEYKAAKANGEPDEEIDAIYRQIIHSKYRGNNDKIERAWILLNVNPIPHKTIAEAQTLRDAGAISDIDFIIKVRFNNFIARFEREQTNVIFFGEGTEFSKRIDTIYSQLKMYANESKQLRTDD